MSYRSEKLRADPRSRDSPPDEAPPDELIDSLTTSVWGDMMRQAVDEEDL